VRGWRPSSAGDGDDAWQRELWTHLKTWADEPARTRNVWLAWGDGDYLREGMPLVASLLPAQHVIVRPGGKHAWSTWTPVVEDVFRAIDAERAAREGG